MTSAMPSGMSAVQATSAKTVGKVLAGRNLDRVLETELARCGTLTPSERAAIHSVAFDTLRHYGLLSSQLDKLLSQPVSQTPVRDLLLVALSQLQFSKAAAHAIVDHAVTTAGQMGFTRAKPLVNAVLRNYLRAPDKYQREQLGREPATYDFPQWWIDRVRKEYPHAWKSILHSAGERPPMWLRVNLRRNSVEEYLQRLARHGMPAQQGARAAVLLEKPVPVHVLPGFKDGLVSVQDEGAQRAASLLMPADGMRILDACAAPGGKTGHLLELANVEMLALDRDERRLQRVRENLDRLGLVATSRTADASAPDTWWDGRPFERILLDAPCTGSGVARRHPDIKWIRRETDIHAFVRQQSRLLNALWNCLSNGGRLLYVTCSIFQKENSNIIEQFRRKHPIARQLRIQPSEPSNAETDNAVNAEIPDGQLLPDHVHDGFYYALLEKRE